MPDTCSVFGCRNRRVKGGNVQFFSFPLKDEIRLKAWVDALQREKFQPSKYSKVCSDHFTSESYAKRPGINVPYLSETAVPSIFKAFPSRSRRKVVEVTNKTVEQRKIINQKGNDEVEQITNKQERNENCLTDILQSAQKDVVSTLTDNTMEEIIVKQERNDDISMNKAVGQSIFKQRGNYENSTDNLKSALVMSSEPSTNDRETTSVGEEITIKIITPEILRLRKKIKILNQRIRRQNKNILSLRHRVATLSDKGLSTQETTPLIENNLTTIFKNKQQNKNKVTKGRRYIYNVSND